MIEFKKAETPEEFKEQLKKFMRLQFGDEWEGFYCDELYDITLTYVRGRDLKIFGKSVKGKGGCHG